MKKIYILLGVIIGFGITISSTAMALSSNPYSGVNTVVTGMVVASEIQNNSQVNKTVVKNEEKPIPFRELNFGVTVRKYVDPDNGNVCYMADRANYNAMSCVSSK